MVAGKVGALPPKVPEVSGLIVYGNPHSVFCNEGLARLNALSYRAVFLLNLTAGEQDGQKGREM